ncbi:acyl-ACP--UDP-N-acetylglucosamine O-acyltransferase [Planctobacterium marinum]|uniref:Acyl-[acyl-carrier-protein]--UDP-N-acetylglucosamine O-acyltransferase n=1 Tax=Planctobacterium marinum TaxID=1631968 RepID=A0AA48HQ26_9ALTE|nr:acyl-[acyl-carrier-protein]--UDP-N-acetylglucosamine O-acyltransferase [Planctobacterium marinum]
MIHPTAVIDPAASVGNNVSIGAFTVIGPDVVIGDDCVIHSHVVIKGPSRIGKGNHIFQFASIGEDCQDKKYAGEPTELIVGDNNVFRECVTVHRGTIQDEGKTIIGSGNLFMAYAHVAHDVRIGDQCIFANNCTLAGHVKVADFAILGGMAALHQFCQIGAHAFVGGGAIILRDLPPFVMLGNDGKPHGINSEGLKRRGFGPETVRAIKQAYRIIYRQGNKVTEAIELLAELAGEHAEVQLMVDFLLTSERGLIR